jgi:HK97 family phage major capsid protein
MSVETAKELRHRRGQLIDQGRSILDKATEEKRDLTQDERVNYDKTWQEAESLRGDIERYEKRMAADKEANDSAEQRQRQMEAEARKGIQLGMKPGDKLGDPDPEDKPAEDAAEVRAKALKEKRQGEYRNRFAGYLNNTLSQDQGQQLAQEYRDLQFDDLGKGGFLGLPMQMQSELIKNVNDIVKIRQYARKFTLDSAASLGFPVLQTKMAAATWGEELTLAGADDTLRFGRRELYPHPGSALILVSEDLLARVPNSESIVIDESARVEGELQENGFMTGTGVKQPLGLFTSSTNGIDTTRDISTGNSTTAMAMDGLKNAKYALKSQYRNANTAWVFHRDGMSQIAKMKDGDGRYLLVDSTQVGEPDMLLGFPVIQSEFAPNTFTTGLYVGLIGDMTFYWIVDTLSSSLRRLSELYALTNQVAFKKRFHVEGAPVRAEAFARVKLA